MLTRESLERYGRLIEEAEELKAEIETLEWECRALETSDTVTGSMVGYPYTRRVYSITGTPGESRGEQVALADAIGEKRAALAEKAKGLRRERRRLTAAIKREPDARMQKILLCRYREGLSWNATADAVGGGNSAESVRMAASRYLERVEKQRRV